METKKNKFASNIKKKSPEETTHKDLQTSRNAGGRPKKKQEDKQTEKIFISLTEKEKDNLTRVTEKYGMSYSGFVRYLLKKENAI